MKKLVVLSVAAMAMMIPVSAQPRFEPRGEADNAFQLRFGQFLPEGGGELWDENQYAFTLDESDFNDFVFGMSFVHAVNNNFEVGVNADFYDDTNISAFRDYTDEGGYLIYHDTRLQMVPITVDVRFLPLGRYRMRPGGREVLQPTFYLGGGCGTTLWEYEELGDFIDFYDPVSPVIFPARFKDSGAAWEVHALAGIELPLSPRFNVLFEARHSWSDDEVDDWYVGSEYSDYGTYGPGKLELGGTSIFVGGSFRY